MITGVHTLIYTTDAEADRAFFRDILGWSHVDNGDGWLIFTMPPSELGIHPAERSSHEITLMCDDVAQTRDELEAKGVEFLRDIRDDGFGLTTDLRLPGGGVVMLYEPKHAIAAKIG